MVNECFILIYFVFQQCDVGEQCAIRKGARIGKLCDCPRGAFCNFFLLKCLWSVLCFKATLSNSWCLSKTRHFMYNFYDWLDDSLLYTSATTKTRLNTDEQYGSRTHILDASAGCLCKRILYIQLNCVIIRFVKQSVWSLFRWISLHLYGSCYL